MVWSHSSSSHILPIYSISSISGVWSQNICTGSAARVSVLINHDSFITEFKICRDPRFLIRSQRARLTWSCSNIGLANPQISTIPCVVIIWVMIQKAASRKSTPKTVKSISASDADHSRRGPNRQIGSPPVFGDPCQVEEEPSSWGVYSGTFLQ